MTTTVRRRVVVDTNALISRLLMPGSIPGRAVRHAVDHAQLLASIDTMNELADVLARDKFDRYVSRVDRQRYLLLLAPLVEMVSIVQPVRACRDPADDKILEVAVNGGADLIVTGDRDLLALDPFARIRIVTPAAYLTL